MVQHGIQPYFALAHVHGLELVERLIRKGYYMGPVNGFFSIGAGGVCGANPFDLMELIRRTPHGSCFTYQTTFRLTHPFSAVCIALGQHTRAGIEDNLWNTTKGVRMSTIEMIERHVRMAKELGRPIATPEQARQMLKIGVTYKSTAETLANLGLPPNRRPGNMGFMVHETDGRFSSGGAGRVRAHPRRGVGGELEPSGSTARHRVKMIRPSLIEGPSPGSCDAPLNLQVTIMADFVEVARVERIPPGSGARFTLADKDVAVFNVDGTICAIADTCPHAGGSLEWAS